MFLILGLKKYFDVDQIKVKIVLSILYFKLFIYIYILKKKKKKLTSIACEDLSLSFDVGTLAPSLVHPFVTTTLRTHVFEWESIPSSICFTVQSLNGKF
jgi:hypothetical protein